MGPKCYTTVDWGMLFESSQIMFIEVEFTTSTLGSTENWMCLFDRKYSGRSTPPEQAEKLYSCLNGILITVCISLSLSLSLLLFADSLDYLQAELVYHLYFYKSLHKAPWEYLFCYSSYNGYLAFLWLLHLDRDHAEDKESVFACPKFISLPKSLLDIPKYLQTSTATSNIFNLGLEDKMSNHWICSWLVNYFC